MMDKRGQPRLKVDKEIFVYNSSNKSGFAGKIFDVGRSGISFNYDIDSAAPDDVREFLSIFQVLVVF